MQGFHKELTENILSFWINNMQDKENGGFYGRMDGHNVIHHSSNKGLILNARLLWTFSSAYRIYGQSNYLEIAEKAYNYIVNHFIDNRNGGLFWELDYKGNPINTKKQIYAQGFALFGFSEFFKASGDIRSLEISKEIFRVIENGRDKENGGYLEAYSEDWKPIEDMRLSNKDANEKKSMNTHLHVLEPYTNLLEIWDSPELKVSLKELTLIFINRILNRETYHYNLFFDEKWNVKSDSISYGHDIEASWLLHKAAEVLKDDKLINETSFLSAKTADAVLKGLLPDGSLVYEKTKNHIDKERHWWVQAEAVVGYMYAFKNSGNIIYKQEAQRLWHYIQNNIVDKNHGEWLWSINADNSSNYNDDKAGFWKCPYHNGRMCMEMIENFGFTK